MEPVFGVKLAGLKPMELVRVDLRFNDSTKYDNNDNNKNNNNNINNNNNYNETTSPESKLEAKDISNVKAGTTSAHPSLTLTDD